MRPPRARPDWGVRGAAGIWIGGREAGGTALAVHPKRTGWRARGTRLFTPVPQARPSLGGVWERPPDLYPNSGASGNPSPHFSENFLSWGPPEILLSLLSQNPRIGCSPGPLKLLSSNSLNWGFWKPLLTSPPKSLSWGRPGTPLSLSLNFLKPSQTLTSNSQNWGLLGTLLLFCSPNL